jgi:hypothetical protein
VSDAAPPPSGDDPAQAVPHVIPLSPEDMSPEDLAKLLMTAGMMPPPGPAGDLPSKGSLRKKLLIAVVIAGIGVGASIMSCVGQSFSYRQAHAMEGIEQQLKEIRASCPSIAPAPPREEAR